MSELCAFILLLQRLLLLLLQRLLLLLLQRLLLLLLRLLLVLLRLLPGPEISGRWPVQILLHPPPPVVGDSTVVERGYQRTCRGGACRLQGLGCR